MAVGVPAPGRLGSLGKLESDSALAMFHVPWASSPALRVCVLLLTLLCCAHIEGTGGSDSSGALGLLPCMTPFPSLRLSGGPSTNSCWSLLGTGSLTAAEPELFRASDCRARGWGTAFGTTGPVSGPARLSLERRPAEGNWETLCED